jgi:hypothetical protein
MDTNGRGNIWNQVRDFKPDRPCLIDAATGMGIDGLNRDFPLSSMLAINGCCNNGGREPRKCPDLEDAPRRENADKRGEKKIIAGADAARIPNIIESDHGMEKIHLARRRDFSGATQLFRELSVLDFELLERFEFADIEISRRR